MRYLLAFCFLAGCAAPPQAGPDPRARKLTPDLLKDAVLVCVDIQDGKPGPPVTRETINPEWARGGITPEDVNRANDYFFSTALPNAAKIARFFRERKLPVILVRWGMRFRDGMDLDPAVRGAFVHLHGPDARKWGMHEDDPPTQVHPDLDPQPTDYILPKAAQDAFTSSNIGFLLKNLGAKNLFLVGGHTGACLGKTSSSAKKAGYTIICVEDATFDASERRRIPNMNAVGYHVICGTRDVLKLR